MKSLKLLAAMAMPIMFAACTSEELYTGENNLPQKMEEAVGADLVGTDLVMNFSKGSDVESRKLRDGSWEKTDLIGMGWIVNGDYNTPQSADKHPSNSILYNNLQFYWDESKNDGEGAFAARGNFYQGWYFSYYPWEYKGDFSVKTVTVNPEQISSNPDDRMSQLLHLSCRQFVSTNDVDKKTGELNKTFRNIPVLNVLGVRTTAKAGSKFEKAVGALAGCEIESVTISAEGYNIFSEETMQIRAAKLPVYDEALVTKKADGNDNALYYVLYKGGAEAGLVINYTDNVTTSVKDGVYTAGDDASIYTLVVPATATLDPTKVTINVKVDCGDFNIKYVPEAEEGSTEAYNNKAIENIVAMYAAEGALTTYNGNVQSVNIELCDDNFTPDFGNVTAENWNAKVTLANTLGLEDVTFTLAKDADIVLSSKIKLPANGVTVKGISGNDFVVEKSYTWKEGLKLGDSKISITVNEGAKLTVDKNVDLSGAKKLTNNGETTAKPGAVIGKDGKNVLTNNNTVYVEYGAYVYPSGDANVIAYKVPKKYQLSQIRDLITVGTAGSANVNTLVVGDGVELNCAVSTVIEGEDADNNPYNPLPGTPDSSSKDVLDLSGINLQINGTGKVTASETYTYEAENVQMNGGIIENVNIKGDLTIIGGENIVTIENVGGKLVAEAGTATLKDVLVVGDATVEEGAELAWSNATINGSLTNEGTINLTGVAKVVITLTNNGNLTTDSDMTVEGDVTLNPGSVTTLKAGETEKTIWYNKGTYTKNGGTLTGAVKKYEAALFATALANAKDGDIITVNADIELTSIPVLAKGTITIKGASKDTKLSLDLDNSTQLRFTKDVIFENITIEGETDYQDGEPTTGYEDMMAFQKAATFKNVTFNTTIAVAGNTTFENCTFNVPGDKSYAMWIANNGQTVTITGSTIDMDRSIKVQRESTTKFGFTVNDKASTLNVSGTTFITTGTKAAVLADGPVNVLWGEGNDITQVKADNKNAVWVDEAYYALDANNAKKVNVVGCTKKIEE